VRAALTVALMLPLAATADDSNVVTPACAHPARLEDHFDGSASIVVMLKADTPDYQALAVEVRGSGRQFASAERGSRHISALTAQSHGRPADRNLTRFGQQPVTATCCNPCRVVTDDVTPTRCGSAPGVCDTVSGVISQSAAARQRRSVSKGAFSFRNLRSS
jgi:hypothetical protein